MRFTAPLALLALVAAASPAAAYLDRDDDCDGVARIVGAGTVSDILSKTALADLDGDGRPDLVCGFAWNTVADLGARAHEACHTVQQGSPADPACHGTGAVYAKAEDVRKESSAECWNQALRLAGTPAHQAAGRACVAIGDLDGDGVFVAEGRACSALPERSLAEACATLTNVQKSKHDAAMAAIQNTR